LKGGRSGGSSFQGSTYLAFRSYEEGIAVSGHHTRIQAYIRKGWGYGTIPEFLLIEFGINTARVSLRVCNML